MNSNNSGDTGSSNSKIQSFLEALRASQSAGSSSNPQEFSHNNPFSEIQAKKEAEKRRAEQFFHARQQEWNQVFSAKEKQNQQRIEEIRAQLKDLSKQVKKLDKNLTRAVEAPITSPGVYHESYIEHIRNMIRLFSLKVNQANSWLEIYNSRSAKQGVYWGMAKSKGTSFTLNNERAIATSVG